MAQIMDPSAADWQAVGDDIREAMFRFVKRHGCSEAWLRRELANSTGPIPDPEIFRQLMPWFPDAGETIIRHSSIIGENRRLAERLRTTWHGRWVLRHFWKNGGS